MAASNVSPARALARLMVAAFAAIVLILALLVGMVGVGDPVEPAGATATASVRAP